MRGKEERAWSSGCKEPGFLQTGALECGGESPFPSVRQQQPRPRALSHQPGRQPTLLRAGAGGGEGQAGAWLHSELGGWCLGSPPGPVV